jgi:hypothetical protein
MFPFVALVLSGVGTAPPLQADFFSDRAGDPVGETPRDVDRAIRLDALSADSDAFSSSSDVSSEEGMPISASTASSAESSSQS